MFVAEYAGQYPVEVGANEAVGETEIMIIIASELVVFSCLKLLNKNYTNTESTAM